MTYMRLPAMPELFVPETISVPLFGKAEVSAKASTNLYELEVSATLGKDAADTPSYSARFELEGTSPVDILALKMEGSGLLVGTPSDSLKAHVKAAVTHKFLEASVSIMEVGTFSDMISVKSSSKVVATSPLGLLIELEHTGTVGFNAEEINADSNLEGSVKAGPIYGNTISTQAFTIFPFRPEAKIDSSLKIDTTILKAQNTIAATFVNGELSVVSNTNAFEDMLTHAAELSFKENKLALNMDTNAVVFGMKVRNQAEASAATDEVIIKMQTNADQSESENRIFSLLTATLDVNGLALTSDAAVKLLENEAVQKTSLKINKEGLAELSIINKAEVRDIKVDNANTLTITLSSLDFDTKAEAIVSEYATYTHDITIALKPYTASANVNNNLKLLAANIINEAQLKAELYKMDLTGSLKAIYGEEEIKHTYEVNYADVSASAKCSTTGKVFGTNMNQNSELEVVGLAARLTNDARFNSQPMRYDHSIRTSIIPFDFNLDVMFNADGDLTLYGKRSGQLYGKFLLRAQPLALVTSNECRASVTQQLNDGFSLETTVDNKMEALVTPQEQKATMLLKSKMNNHVLSQEVNAYNNAERLGLEMSNTFLTSVLNTESSENQEFSISGFLKYDKSTESTMIVLPFIEKFPALLENIKVVFVSMAEAMQNYLNNEDIKAKIEAIPQYVSDFVSQLNIEGKAVQLKQTLIDFTQEYVITIEELEASLMNLKDVLEKMLTEIASRMQDIISSVKEMIASGTLSETVINRLNQELNTFLDEYNIRDMIVAIVDAIEEVIKQIDLQKLSESSLSFLRDLDVQFDVKAKLEMVVSKLKEFIASFDITEFAEQLKTYISSLYLDAYIQELMAQFPTNLFGTTVETLKELIQQFDILEKVVELIKQFKIDETVQVLANNLKAIDIPGKIMQVLETAINYLKATEIKQVIEQINVYLDTIVQQLKSFNYNAFADEVNQMISAYSAQVNELIKALEIPQKLEAIREFVNFALSTVMNYLEQLNLNYLPALPVISFPEITLPEFSFPVIPAVPVEKLIETLQIPEFKLPNIPTEFMVPAFGKLYGEMRVNSPIYSIRHGAELQRSVDAENAAQVTAVVTSQATSPSFEILNFNLDSTARVAVPEARNVIVSETLKFTHSVLELDHQASVTLKDLSAQATAKTTVKATTSPYSAELVNEAFFATAGGLSGTIDTTYSHMLNLPIIGITSETSLTQKAVARQEGTTITLTLGNEGTAKFNSHDGVHKSDLLFTINPNTAKLTFTSDTDTALLKMKQTLNADSVTLSYFKFDARSEAEGPAVKNSLLVASGNVNLYDTKIELKATHDTELVGTLSGVLSNAVNIVIRPVEILLDFQNKGNTVLGSIAKIDLQNDYSATYKPDTQKFNTVALARLNQYKLFYNVTVNNNEQAFGIFADVDGETNLDILATPISIPELNLPFVVIRTPAISDLNLYEITGLKNILTTTEQNVAVATKIVYQKSMYAPLVDVMGLIQIPSVGNLITELSFKSAIINLNLNAGLYNEEDIVFRLGATTTSEFESLKAKLDGTTSLTTKRGIKLANSLSLENPHIEGTHENTITVNPETFEAAVSVATAGKIALPILNLEANQNLVADTKTKANAVSTLKLKGEFNA